jgi:hypothetical protein
MKQRFSEERVRTNNTDEESIFVLFYIILCFGIVGITKAVANILYRTIKIFFRDNKVL